MQEHTGRKKRKLKIIYAITKSNWGGAQRYVYDLARYAREDGHDVLVVGGGEGALFVRLAEAGVPTQTLPVLGRDVSTIKDISAFIALTKLLRKERPDVFHVNSSKIGAVGALAGRIARVPRIIFTAHGWAHKEERSAVSRRIIYLIHLLTVLLSHKTIAVSEEVRRQMNSISKISVVHNGIQDIHFEDKESARQSLRHKASGLEKKKWYIGMIGELHKNKGLPYAIRAARLLPEDAALCIVGGGEEENNLKTLVQEEGLEEKIFFTGYIADAPRYLRAFDIFLMTSIKEGFPYALLEAGMAKLPVIATNVGGIGEIVEDLKTGILIKPRREDEIRDAILFFLHNPEKGAEMAQALHKKVAEEFSLETMYKKTFALYK